MFGGGMTTETLEAIETKRKLDVGSGAKKLDGFETMDLSPVYSPDFQHDLTQFPWPFDDDTFDEVHCHHVLEHIERKHLISVMNEMHRILKPGGMADIEVPIFPYWTAIADPTHVSFFVPQTFHYFGDGVYQGNDYREQRSLYGVQEWHLDQMFRDQMGSILRVEMSKP